MKTLTSKAKVIITAVAAAVVAAGIVAGVLLTRQDSYRVLKVFELMGTASVTRESAGDLDAYVGMNLESGDVVSVDDNSNMRISLDSDKYVLLDAGTVLELVAAGNEKDSRTTLNLKEGAILNEITSALSENSSYDVNAPKATMAVRGTSYSVTVTKDGDRYIIELDTFHGKVAVRLISEDGTPGEEVMVGEGKSVLIITEPNENTHNSPDIDGHSYFVIRDPEAEGGYRKVDISEAVFDSEYDFLAASIKERVVSSNNSGLFQIKDAIIEKLTGTESENDVTTVATSFKGMAGGSGTSAAQTAAPAQTAKPAQTSSATTAPRDPEPINSDNYTAPAFTESTTAGTTATSAEVPAQASAAESTFGTGDYSNGTNGTGTTSASNFVSGTGVTAPANSDTSGTSRRETSPRTTGQGTQTSPDVTNPNVTAPTDPTGSGFSPLVTTRPTGTASQTSATTRPYVTTNPTTTTTAVTDKEPEVFTVTFLSDNGTVLYTRDVESGDTVSNFPQVPAKTGYTGVWLVSGKNTRFTAATVVTSDMSVYASYTAKEYTITMNVEGTTTTMTAKYGDSLSDVLPAVPAKTGHDGIWTINGAAISSTAKVTGNMTVTAKYTPKTYTVTIIVGTERDTKTAKYGTLLSDILPTIPEKKGYHAAWTVDGSPLSDTAAVTDDITVTAEYVQKEFTVNYMDKYSTYSETYADNGEKLLDVLDDPDVGNELDLKYVWLTRYNAWTASSNSGMVKVNDSHVVTKDIDSGYEVQAVEKQQITYYIGDDINGYTAGGSFYLLTNLTSETISEVQPGYLGTILPASYSGFAYDYYGDAVTFTENDAAYGVDAIYTYNYLVTFKSADDTTVTKRFPTGKTIGDLPQLPQLSDPTNNVWAYYEGDVPTEVTSATQVNSDMNIIEMPKSEVIFHTVTYTRADGTTGTIRVGEGASIYGSLTSGGLTPAEGYSWIDESGNEISSDTVCTGDMTITEKGDLVTLEFYYGGTLYRTENVRIGEEFIFSSEMLIGTTGAPFSTIEALQNDSHVWKFTVDGVEYTVSSTFTVTGAATVYVTME
jgi:hypothetical protein